jgi:hypothetical protein
MKHAAAVHPGVCALCKRARWAAPAQQLIAPGAGSRIVG